MTEGADTVVKCKRCGKIFDPSDACVCVDEQGVIITCPGGGCGWEWFSESLEAFDVIVITSDIEKPKE